MLTERRFNNFVLKLRDLRREVKNGEAEKLTQQQQRLLRKLLRDTLVWIDHPLSDDEEAEDADE